MPDQEAQTIRKLNIARKMSRGKKARCMLINEEVVKFKRYYFECLRSEINLGVQ